jgi:hypothetical protein
VEAVSELSRKERPVFAFKQIRFAPRVEPFRWTARASSLILFALWLSYFVFDIPRTPLNGHSTGTFAQAGALAVVFAGYIIGWRWELAGGLTALMGTLAFFYAVAAATHVVLGPGALLFAVPGALYLLAWQYETPHALP